jgi:hypothetical protein
VSNSWRSKYRELTDFIGKQPEIEIETSSVKIPVDTRQEFYRLFDATRVAILEETLPNLLCQAIALSRNYLKAEKEVVELLELEDIVQPNPLGWFLRNPVDGMIRELFEPLFDLLKGKVDVVTFEKDSTQPIRNSFKRLYELGYDKWIALSIIKLLDADLLFQVVQRRIIEHEEWTIIRSNNNEEAVPSPQRAKYISFEHLPEDLFAVPDFIVHSAKLNRYVSFRGEVNTTIATGLRTSEKREWCSPYPAIFKESGSIFIYVDDTPDDIALVADAKKICKPDMLIQCRGLREQSEVEDLEQVRLCHDILKPVIGTYVILGEFVQEQVFTRLEDNIHIIETGFDTEKLVPIVDALLRRF